MSSHDIHMHNNACLCMKGVHQKDYINQTQNFTQHAPVTGNGCKGMTQLALTSATATPPHPAKHINITKYFCLVSIKNILGLLK